MKFYLVIGFFLAFVFFINSSYGQQQTDMVKIETRDFTVSIPNNWYYQEYTSYSNEVYAIKAIPLDDVSGTFVIVAPHDSYNKNNAPLKMYTDYVKKEVLGTGSSIISEEETIIDGQKALKVLYEYTFDDISKELRLQFYVLSNNDPFYVYYTTYLPTGENTNYNKYLPEVEKIVNSIKFK